MNKEKNKGKIEKTKSFKLELKAGHNLKPLGQPIFSPVYIFSFIFVFLLLNLLSSYPALAENPQAQNQVQNRVAARVRAGQPESEKSFSISGQVFSWKNEPVAKAVVLIPELGLTVETDSNGHFAFDRVPAGKYHLQVIAENFMENTTEEFTLDRNLNNFKITLVEKIHEEVVVTGTSTAKLYSETPVRVQVIAPVEIERKQAVNLAEALATTTGLRVENDCQNCNFTQVRINGMEGKYSQILVDGVPMMTAMTSVYGLEQIPTEMIERIEIVKGGTSTLYGSNAIAGVINIISREPESNQVNLGLREESIHDRTDTNVDFRTSYVSKDSNLKGFFFANLRKREPIDLNNDGFSDLGKLNQTSFGMNLIRDFDSLKAKLKFNFYRIFEERRGGNAFDQPPHMADVCEWIKSDQVGLSSEWNQTISENFYYSLILSFLDARRNTYYGSHQDPNAYGNTFNPLFFAGLHVYYQLKSHLLTFGYQFKSDRINDQAVCYNRRIDQTYTDSGFFVQDEYKISEKFSFLTGIRASKSSVLNYLVFNPRVNLLYNASKDLTFRLGYSTGFRAPQVFEEDLHITQVGGTGLVINNSPNLKAETSQSFSLGADFGRAISNNLMQLSGELFYTRLAHTFVLQEITTTETYRLLQRINGSGAKVYGGSADLKISFGPWVSLQSGWTLQNDELDVPEPDFGCREFFKTPKSYGYASLSYQNDRIINVDLTLDYTGRMKLPHYRGYISEDRLETTNSFWVVNLRMKKNIAVSGGSNLAVSVGLDNIFNSFQKDLDRGADRDSGYIYGPAKPRTFFVSLGYRI